MEILNIDKSKLTIVYENGTNLKIPSQMFPLNGKLEIFNSYNTEDINDEVIESIFNSINPRVGKCYYNAQELVDELLKNGIESNRIKTYVGWMFISDTLPVHHCFVMIDNMHVLDFGPLKQFEDFSNYEDNTGLERFKKDIISSQTLQNSEKMSYGKALSVVTYIVSECAPKEGEKIRAKLEKAFPKHICF